MELIVPKIQLRMNKFIGQMHHYIVENGTLKIKDRLTCINSVPLDLDI